MGEHDNNENFKTIASFVIKLRSNGSIGVEGPIHDKILCLGMLEIAKDLVLGQKQPEQESKIIKPILMPPGNLGRG